MTMKRCAPVRKALLTLVVLLSQEIPQSQAGPALHGKVSVRVSNFRLDLRVAGETARVCLTEPFDRFSEERPPPPTCSAEMSRDLLEGLFDSIRPADPRTRPIIVEYSHDLPIVVTRRTETGEVVQRVYRAREPEWFGMVRGRVEMLREIADPSAKTRRRTPRGLFPKMRTRASLSRRWFRHGER